MLIHQEDRQAQATRDNSVEIAGGRWHTARPGDVLHTPAHLADALAPASLCLYEWSDYYAEYPEADWLRVGSEQFFPVAPGTFRIRFENQLGLADIQPYKGQTPLHSSEWVEVISRKFPDVDQHWRFFGSLLDAVITLAAQLPFIIHAETGRGVTHTMRPPTLLFILHYLRQYASELQTALNVITVSPHRQLLDYSDFVPMAEATEAGPDVLLGILQSPEEWVPARGFTLANELGGYAPARVRQQLPQETYDTPENRFVLAFLRELMTATGSLQSYRWWSKVVPEHQDTIRSLAKVLRHVSTHSMFDEVRTMHYLPTASQVLLRREGYRETLNMWRLFHQSRRPLFDRLQHAIDLRDVATLYEMWVFLGITQEIGKLLTEEPVIDVRLSEREGLERGTTARFGEKGKLVYNLSSNPKTLPSYSVPLRPDFVWMKDGKAKVVLDAKFRLDRQAFSSDIEDTPQATAKRADLYKMHTYRDALGVPAAVCVYPGDVSKFYGADGTNTYKFTLEGLLETKASGIGMIAMKPGN